MGKLYEGEREESKREMDRKRVREITFDSERVREGATERDI